MLTMTEVAARPLYEYLKAHESDIANDIDDFGTLNPIFTYIFGKKPE